MKHGARFGPWRFECEGWGPRLVLDSEDYFVQLNAIGHRNDESPVDGCKWSIARLERKPWATPEIVEGFKAGLRVWAVEQRWMAAPRKHSAA